MQIQAKPDIIVPSLDYPVLESGLSVPSSSKTHAVYETNNVESQKTGERVLRFSIKWKDGVFPVTLNDSCSVGKYSTCFDYEEYFLETTEIFFDQLFTNKFQRYWIV